MALALLKLNLAHLRLGNDGAGDVPEVEQLADITADSWNPKERTFEMRLYSGAPVLRRSWMTGRSWMMQFSFDDGALRTGRLKAGIPIMMAHGDTPLVDPQIGISRDFSVQETNGSRALHVVAQLSDRAEVQPIAGDVAAKIKKHVSMGAQPFKVKVTPSDEEKKTLEHWMVQDWEVLEGSLVAVPADFGAHILSGDELEERPGRSARKPPRANRCIVVVESALDPKTGRLTVPGDEEGARVTPEELEAQRLANEAATSQAVALAEKKTAAETLAKERTRVSLVRQLCKAHRCSDEFTTALEARTEATDVEIRDAVLADLGGRAAKIPTPVTKLGLEPADHRKAGMIEALEFRVGLRERVKVSEAGLRFLSGTAVRSYERYLEEEGQKLDGSDIESVGRLAFGMIGSSDLPKVFENIAEKSLMKGYTAIPTTFQLVSQSVSGSDFKDRAVVHTGLGPKLVQVKESAEIPSGGAAEGGEKYRIVRFAIIKPYSFEALRNDDLGAIGREQENLGKQAALNVDETLWALVTGNATMGDGVTLFHSSHANLAGSGKNFTLVGSNAALGIAELERVLRVQTDDDGVTLLGTPPAFIMGPAALAYQLRQLTSGAINPNAQNQVPVFSFLNPIINPRLDASSAIVYYLIAPKEILPLFEIAYLDGNQLPKIDSQEGFDQDALRIRCRWYWGGALTNHRAIAKSTGADA